MILKLNRYFLFDVIILLLPTIILGIQTQTLLENDINGETSDDLFGKTVSMIAVDFLFMTGAQAINGIKVKYI